MHSWWLYSTEKRSNGEIFRVFERRFTAYLLRFNYFTKHAAISDAMSTLMLAAIAHVDSNQPFSILAEASS